MAARSCNSEEKNSLQRLGQSLLLKNRNLMCDNPRSRLSKTWYESILRLSVTGTHCLVSE